MALTPRNHKQEEIATDAAREAFRIVIERLQVDEETGQIRIAGLGRGGVEKLQAVDTVYAQPYGFRGLPVKETDGVFVEGSPRNYVQSTIATPPEALRKGSRKQGAGESALYDHRGNLIMLRGDDGAEVDVSGGTTKKLKVHKGGAVGPVALNQEFLDDYNAFKTRFDAHTHVYNTPVHVAVAAPTAAPDAPAPSPTAAGATTLDAE